VVASSAGSGHGAAEGVELIGSVAEAISSTSASGIGSRLEIGSGDSIGSGSVAGAGAQIISTVAASFGDSTGVTSGRGRLKRHRRVIRVA
jgi:hypothetical protein